MFFPYSDKPFKGPFKGWDDDVDMIKSRVPHLPHITSLSVNISLWLGRHGYGAGVANLLTRFDNLRRLSLHLPFFKSLVSTYLILIASIILSPFLKYISFKFCSKSNLSNFNSSY